MQQRDYFSISEAQLSRTESGAALGSSSLVVALPLTQVRLTDDIGSRNRRGSFSTSTVMINSILIGRVAFLRLTAPTLQFFFLWQGGIFERSVVYW